MMGTQEKLSLCQGALFLGIPEATLKSLQETHIIQAHTWIGSTPIFLKDELRRLKDLRQEPVDPIQEVIRTRRSGIEETIGVANQQLKALQEECTHPKATKENKANTGNWDQSQDCYWRECHCPDCGKRWTEDQ